jgi:serine/threonine protein kinase
LHFEAKLGAGVSSTVYRGTYEGKRIVAIKVIKLERAQKDLKDFKKELYIMSQVHSPHVVEFYGATLEPKLCVVMELCPHGTLFHALTEPLPGPRLLDNTNNSSSVVVVEWERALTWCSQIATGMATLHDFEPQIVHRDLKPLNLLLDVAWNVKICDFGLSRYTSADQPSDEMQTLTKLRGTYAYTAPEIYHKAQYSAKSDVYSMAVIFWELGTRLVTGVYARPFAEYAELKYDYQIIYQTATQQLRPTFANAFPSKFRQIIQACWTQEPERRPSATQLLEGLDIAKKDWEKFPKKWTEL